MTHLAELQRSFQAFVTGSAHAPPAMISGNTRASAQSRMQIYAEAIDLRFLEALGEDYPGVHGLLGDESFRQLAHAYAAAHPSHFRSMRWFGMHLPELLRADEPWCEHPVLAEMARFEWSKGELVDAADISPIGVEDIAAIPAARWAGMRPRFVHALRQLTLEWNVPALWSALETGETPPPPTRLEHPVDWLLWRQGISIRWRSIDAHEAWALRACAGGADFDVLCNGLCERIGRDAAPLRAATYLKQWASDGLLAAV
jgi:Putative DNA-binding domain